MRYFFIFYFILFFLGSNLKASAFTEIFGSEGAAGINNPKIRSLSYAFQYLTLSGSIGYLGKQLFDSGFFSPFNIVPDEIINLSPLGYKDYFTTNTHNANILSVKARSDQINLVNNFRNQMNNNTFSFKSIEFRNKGNFSKSIYNLNERDQLIDRYLND
jgi:hypothetical protein